MLDANLSAAGLCTLFANQTPALEDINLGQVFPYLVGVVLALGIVLVGLVMPRRRFPAGRPSAPGSLEDQPDPLHAAPSQLWKLVFPAIAVLVLGGVGLFFIVLPVLKEVADVKASLEEQMKANQEAAKKKTVHDSSVYYPRSSSPPLRLGPPPPQPLVPGFAPPPPPHTPSTYIDSRGVFRVR